VIRSTPGDEWLPKTAVDSSSQFSTMKSLKAQPYKVCYATRESGGDAGSDFVQLAAPFAQAALQFAGTPALDRVVAGSGPYNVSLLGALELNEELFLQRENCTSLGRAVGVTASPSHTVHTTSKASVFVLPSLQAGSYVLCRRPAYTLSVAEMPGIRFSILTPPTFSPPGGNAGEVTVVTFSGDVKPGDLIVLKANNCLGAATATANTNTLSRSIVSSQLQITTTASMTADTILKVCFATHESGGLMDADYVALGDFVQSSVSWDFL